MLKPVEPTLPPERPIGELVHELIEGGKGYARAEIDLYRKIVVSKARGLAIPAALFAAALFIAMAALNALAFGVVLALAKFIGPLAAGFIGMLIFAALAGLLVWIGLQQARDVL
jgi:Putative Actinobacterial Holin-X, holin superfamily III